MMRLYCPDLHMFVDPTDRNVLVWYQQHRTDPTIGILQTFMLYEQTRLVNVPKHWDAEARKIRYASKRAVRESGRYPLFTIPWSGFFDRNSRPVFHGDIVGFDDTEKTFVCAVYVEQAKSGTWLLDTSGWDDNPPSPIFSGSHIIDNAIISPSLVAEPIRNLFVYTKPNLQ